MGFFTSKKQRQPFNAEWVTDCCGVKQKNLGFRDEPTFAAAWENVQSLNAGLFPKGVPDIRWRAHMAVWAARHGLTLDGDFVEFGVNTGILSSMICRSLDFAKVRKTFYLFDTFSGIPEASTVEGSRHVAKLNAEFYPFDAFPVAQRTFADYPNVRLVKGILPGTIATVPIERIAFLSIDLNIAEYELASVQEVWDRVTPGAVILLDDYAWAGHEAQYDGWNEFARSAGTSIASLPTGQGLMIRP